MERSEMLRPTSCDLSLVINVNKETESNEDTEPRHCRNIVLGAGHVPVLIKILAQDLVDQPNNDAVKISLFALPD
jgi:hypothetical protein